MMSKICRHCGEEFYKNEKSNAYNWKTKLYCNYDCCTLYWNERREHNDSAYYKFRFNIFSRDEFSCVYCGRNPGEDGAKMELEHLVPRRGKTHGWDDLNEDNFVTSCRECNVGKSDTTLSVDTIREVKRRLKK